MAKLVYGMNQSLDGYVDYLELTQLRSPLQVGQFKSRPQFRRTFSCPVSSGIRDCTTRVKR